MTKIAKITREQGRAIHGKVFHDGMYFNPILTADMDIVITEQEVNQLSNEEFPWVAELSLVEPEELSKQNLDEEAKLEAAKADIENNLAEVNAKLAEIKK